MQKACQHSVHPTGGSLRVFRQFAWLEVDSVKMALSRPTHQRVTQAVGRLNRKLTLNKYMATSSSIKRLNPRLQSVFGLLTPSDDTEIRNILNKVDVMLLEFAQYFGSNRAGWEGTGLDLTWFPSGQIEISSFVGAGIDSSHRVDFIVSLHPTWSYGDFPAEQAWGIEAEIHADCQHKVDHECMHVVFALPIVTKTHPIDSVAELHNMTTELIQLGKDKPLEHWLELAGDNELS